MFLTVPRIGEGVHLPDHAGARACFDVIDVWYQKAEFGEVWVPYIHVRKSGDAPFASGESAEQASDLIAQLKEGTPTR